MKKVDLTVEAISPLVGERRGIDEKWLAVAQRRLGEIRSGKVKTVPGEEVFRKVMRRYSWGLYTKISDQPKIRKTHPQLVKD